jgi:branched-chain amino acid transport system permease protein
MASANETVRVEIEPKRSDAIVSLVVVASLWAAAILFLLIPDQYVSFVFAAAVSLGIWAFSRWSPRNFDKISQAIANRSDVAAIVSLIVLLAIPFILKHESYWIHVFTIVLIYGFVVQGLNIHLGEIGAINVGYAGFFAVGAYCSAILTVDYGVSFWGTLVWATLACWVVGLLVGACTIRTTGDYLSLVTLAFGLVVYQLAVNMSWLTHGTDGLHIPKPSFFGHRFDHALELGIATLPREANFYYLSLFFLVCAMLVSKRTVQSWVGRTWAAMRQDRVGASCFGINVPVMQVLSFAFGASFAGIAGALHAAEIGFIEPREFTIVFSITAICMVILGGMGNWWGVVIGAFIMIVVPEKLRAFQELRFFLYGLVLLFILIHRPHGLFPSPRRKHEKILG